MGRFGGRCLLILACLLGSMGATASAAGTAATPSFAQVPPPVNPYVVRCSTRLCLGSETFPWQAASVYSGLADPAYTVRTAIGARLNVIRVVDFLDVTGAVRTAPFDEGRWRRVDALIAAAGRAGLHVELDLSTYRNLLARHGVNPYSYNWDPFVRYVTGRRNVYSGRNYALDPTIALVAVAGEVDPPHGKPNSLHVTTAQVTSFFGRTLGQWRARDPHHLLTTGGLLQLDWDSGVDWRRIMALPLVDVCAVHMYGDGDRKVSVPAVSNYCGGLSKPWITEEFGHLQSDGDAKRAAEFTADYDLQSRYGSAGAGFWNLGSELGGQSHDVSSGTRLTWQIVRAHAPVPINASDWRRMSMLVRLHAS